MGISEERKGKPLIVPRTGTRALVPKTCSTLKGALSAATELPSMPSSLTSNVIFFIVNPSTSSFFRSICLPQFSATNLKCHPERSQIIRGPNDLAESKDPGTTSSILSRLRVFSPVLGKLRSAKTVRTHQRSRRRKRPQGPSTALLTRFASPNLLRMTLEKWTRHYARSPQPTVCNQHKPPRYPLC